MARIVLKDGITLKGARRALTMRGSTLRITQRNGKLYTFRKFRCVQPNSEKQMEWRERMRRANELAREDMARDGRKEHWAKMAKERGYKTAIGCARAWYMREGIEENGKAESEKRQTEPRNIAAKRSRMAREEEKETVMVIGKRWTRTGRERTRARRTITSGGLAKEVET